MAQHRRTLAGAIGADKDAASSEDVTTRRPTQSRLIGTMQFELTGVSVQYT